MSLADGHPMADEIGQFIDENEVDAKIRHIVFREWGRDVKVDKVTREMDDDSDDCRVWVGQCDDGGEIVFYRYVDGSWAMNFS